MFVFACYAAARPSRLLLGDKKRLVQRHFAAVVRQVSVCPLGCVGVADGDVIPGTGKGCSVLWPPRKVWSDDPYGQAMQIGIEAFEAAAEADREIGKAYKMTVESKLAEQYRSSMEHIDRPSNEAFPARDDEHADDQRDVERPLEDYGERVSEIEVCVPGEEEETPPVRRANQALRKV